LCDVSRIDSQVAAWCYWGVLVRCRHCGFLHGDPGVSLNGYSCARCGSHDLERVAAGQPQGDAILLGAAGATLGGVAFGPVGAVIGGILGLAAGSRGNQGQGGP